MAINFQTSKRDLIVSAIALAAFVAYCGYVWTDIHTKRAALEVRAKALVEEMYKQEEREGLDWLLDVRSGKVNYLFGTDWGVIRFYARKTGDVGMESFLGLERFMKYEAGTWQETDFAKIDQPAHIYEGYEYFEANGYEVSEDAYKRYN